MKNGIKVSGNTSLNDVLFEKKYSPRLNKGSYTKFIHSEIVSLLV